jgi:hypothetical protein
MVYFSVLVYLFVGLRAVEDVSSPKFQDQIVDDLILLSVNLTVSNAFPDIGDTEKAATSAYREDLTVI